MSLQLIDENKQFSSHVSSYFDQLGLGSGADGLNYHIVSVFGSQSTGKSTLLNALFGTSFHVMDETARQQTTKGIWMARSQLVGEDDSDSAESGDSFLHVKPQDDTTTTKRTKRGSDILVLDVEGTDGRERGEDQDFERKSALFALATSEVLIVNMWENQVGLYQGANMGLLKTVFEVNLSLFQASNQTPRSLVMFVIRDHIGTTPLANLQATLLADLNRAWDSIAKPDNLKESKISDFFDFKFEALAHKVLLPEKFTAQVDSLAQKLTSGGYVKPEYHRRVPLDGWSMYASNIWEQIELNKDLDLPTQQILVARFRCSEIAAQATAQFDEALSSLGYVTDSETVLDGFGANIKTIRTGALELYDSMAARYTQKVYLGQRLDLVNTIDTKLSGYFSSQLSAVHKKALKKFQTAELPQSSDFGNVIARERAASLELYTSLASEAASIDADTFSYSKELATFTKELNQAVDERKQREIDRIVQKCTKKIASIFNDELDSFFASPDKTTWDSVMQFFNSTVDLIVEPYSSGEETDFAVGASSQANLKGAFEVRRNAWSALDTKLREITLPASVVALLQDQFDRRFRYDKNGVPVVWTAHDDLETPYATARDYALELVPIFALAKTADGIVIRPDVEWEEEERDFGIRLSPGKKNEIIEKFKRQADAAFVDAKRSTTQLATQVPLWMIALLVVLGWNEFMAVLRNPFLFIFVLLAGAGAWITFTLNMWGPMLSVTNAMYGRALDIAKEKLRDLLEIPAHHQPVKTATGVEVRSSVPGGSNAFSPFSPAAEEVELKELKRVHTRDN